MKTLWMEISDLTGGSGQWFRLGGSEVLHACGACDAAFPQTDEGWRALKDHEFELHERPIRYDWTELHGQEVTILVVQRADEPSVLDPSGMQTELVARAKDGTLYFLPFSYYDQGDRGGFKCKPRSRATSLLGLTPPDPASPSHGSKSTDASRDDATAERTAAKAGRWRTSKNSNGRSIAGSPRRERSRCSKTADPARRVTTPPWPDPPTDR